jgi:hypothetical protein
LTESLVTAYLSWQYHNKATTAAKQATTATTTATTATTITTAMTATATDETTTTAAESWDFEIRVVDIYTLNTRASISRSSDCESVAEALVLNGYLGTSPLNPLLAISLKTLDLYHKIRIRKPSFSVEAFAKVICDLYTVSI